jgi:hypothetical protein
LFKIDAKTLQLRWTDIEIRKHVMPSMETASADDLDDKDLQPIENFGKKESKAASPVKNEAAHEASDRNVVAERNDSDDDL